MVRPSDSLARNAGARAGAAGGEGRVVVGCEGRVGSYEVGWAGLRWAGLGWVGDGMG